MPAYRSLFAITLLSLASVALLAGCSTPTAGTPSTAATDTGDGGTSPTDASSVPAASGPDACTLVSESVLTAALGTDPGAGVSSPGNGGTGSTTCSYGTAVIVQVSLQADLYLPAAVYSTSAVEGSAATAVGDRGYVADYATFVAQGQTGVLVTYSHKASLDQGQALAAAIVGGL